MSAPDPGPALFLLFPFKLSAVKVVFFLTSSLPKYILLSPCSVVLFSRLNISRPVQGWPSLVLLKIEMTHQCNLFRPSELVKPSVSGDFLVYFEVASVLLFYLSLFSVFVHLGLQTVST